MADMKLKMAGEKSTCILCGDELVQLEKAIETICDFCGNDATVKYHCNSGHYICETCLEMPVEDFVKKTCLEYKGSDPIELAVKIMNSPVVRMHGPEHHFIVPAVLTTVMHNTGRTGNANLKSLLEVAAKRALQETPHICEYKEGNCGAGVGTGVFFNIFSGIDSNYENKFEAEAVIEKSLEAIAESGGPRCCKRDTYLALQTTAEYLNSRFNTNFPISEAKCTFSLRNRTCKHEECQFYNLTYSVM